MGKKVLVAMPTSHTPPLLPPHPVQSFLHVRASYRARRCENHWMPNLVKMADGVTPPVLNRKSV
jgi:hypothetical protein